jgi:hypothetical protein
LFKAEQVLHDRAMEEIRGGDRRERGLSSAPEAGRHG